MKTVCDLCKPFLDFGFSLYLLVVVCGLEVILAPFTLNDFKCYCDVDLWWSISFSTVQFFSCHILDPWIISIRWYLLRYEGVGILEKFQICKAPINKYIFDALHSHLVQRFEIECNFSKKLELNTSTLSTFKFNDLHSDRM